MGYRQNRPFKTIQRFFQRFPGVAVKVIGRLIQHKKVLAPQHQLGQRHPRLFTARQGADRLEHIISGKQEQTQSAARLMLQEPGKIIPHLAQNCLLRMKRLLLLIIIAYIGIGPESEGAGIRGQITHQNLQHRRLANAIGADQGDPLA